MSEDKELAWLHELVIDESQAITESRVETTGYQTCFEHYLLVSRKNRSVVCKKCGLEFTAFDALMYVIGDWAHMAENLRSMKHDVMTLQEKREKLRKQVQSLKAMHKRAEAKGASGT